MTIGLILLLIAGILVLLGVGQRVLDKLRLTDRQALFWMAMIAAGGFLPDIRVIDQFRFNIGGALIPLALSVYLWIPRGNARAVWLRRSAWARRCTRWAGSCRASRRIFRSIPR